MSDPFVIYIWKFGEGSISPPPLFSTNAFFPGILPNYPRGLVGKKPIAVGGKVLEFDEAAARRKENKILLRFFWR